MRCLIQFYARVNAEGEKKTWAEDRNGNKQLKLIHT